MSFFDDDPDEATRARRPAGGRPGSRPATPRRTSGAARPRASAAGPGGGRTVDDQQLLIRRAVAGGIGLLVLLLLIVGVNSCRSSRRESALKDYNRQAGVIAAANVAEVSQPFFQLMSQGANEARDLKVQVNSLRLKAEDQVKEAKGLDVPSQMGRAETYLTLALNLRAEALRRIADRIDDALVTGRDNAQTAEDAVRVIAGQMEAFLASDVVYSQRVQPWIDETLKDNGITNQRITPSRFLPSLAWLSPDEVAGRLGAQRAGGGTGANPSPPAGTHGHGLVSVSVGGTVLQPSPAVNRIPSSPNPAFTVKFQNQGENDEPDVGVTVRVRSPSGGKPITARKTINQTKAGAEATVTIPLGQAPPTGQSVTIEVAVEGVPGEKKTDNNKQSYTALFTR